MIKYKEIFYIKMGNIPSLVDVRDEYHLYVIYENKLVHEAFDSALGVYGRVKFYHLTNVFDYDVIGSIRYGDIRLSTGNESIAIFRGSPTTEQVNAITKLLVRN